MGRDSNCDQDEDQEDELHEPIDNSCSFINVFRFWFLLLLNPNNLYFDFWRPQNNLTYLLMSTFSLDTLILNSFTKYLSDWVHNLSFMLLKDKKLAISINSSKNKFSRLRWFSAAENSIKTIKNTFYFNLRTHWRFWDDFKNKQRSVRSNVFWYEKVCTFWK